MVPAVVPVQTLSFAGFVPRKTSLSLPLPPRSLASVAIGALSVAIFFQTVPARAAGLQYHVTDLGVLPGFTLSEAHGINDSGQVVGLMNNATSAHAFLWTSGGMQDLGELPGGADVSFGNAVNSSGEVAGSSVDASANHRAFLWTSGAACRTWESCRVAITPVLPMELTDSGQVVGRSGAATASSGSSHAFLWPAAEACWTWETYQGERVTGRGEWHQRRRPGGWLWKYIGWFPRFSLDQWRWHAEFGSPSRPAQ